MLRKFREWLETEQSIWSIGEQQVSNGNLAEIIRLSAVKQTLKDGRIVEVRIATVGDIPDIVRIQELSYNGTAPWNATALEHEIKRNRRALYLIASLESQTVAFVGTWFVEGEAHITNLAVVPTERQKGLAYYLLKEIEQLAEQQGMHQLSLEVRVSNATAQSLYRKLGFKAGKVKKDYYAGDHEDALEMSKPILRKRDIHGFNE